MSTQDKPTWLSLQPSSQVPSLFVCLKLYQESNTFYLFIWLCWNLVVARRISLCHSRSLVAAHWYVGSVFVACGLSCSMA